MNITTWRGWSEYYATLFGLNSEADTEMLISWCDLFSSAGFSIEELVYASKHLALSGAPKFRTDHLRMLQDAVKEIRKRANQQAAEAEPEVICQLCGGSGMVCVPHPRHMGGEIGWCECAVLCRCPLGLWKADRSPEWLRLRDYEMRYPGWQGVALEHLEFIRARNKAEAVTKQADDRLGSLFDKILNRTTQRERVGS